MFQQYGICCYHFNDLKINVCVSNSSFDQIYYPCKRWCIDIKKKSWVLFVDNATNIVNTNLWQIYEIEFLLNYNSFSCNPQSFLIVCWNCLKSKPRDFTEVNISKYNSINSSCAINLKFLIYYSLICSPLHMYAETSRTSRYDHCLFSVNIILLLK